MVATNYLTTLLVLILGISPQQGGAVFVAEGGVAVLPCDLQFDPSKEFAWIKRDHGAVLRLLPSGVIDAFHPFRDRVSLRGSSGLDLRIENVGSSPIDWGGPYTCQQQGVPNGTPQELVKALPPDPAAPTITGYSGEYLTVGNSLTLTCVSTGARPPSDLTWWRGDAQVQASSSHTPDSTGQGDTRSELNIAALRPADNSAVYECRANQLALTQVETREVTLNVAFLEDTPTITGYTAGTAVDSGTTLTLTCTSGNSNPAATITWSRDGTTVPGTNNREQPGNHGGMVTSQDQVIVLQPQLNGARYTCRATNSELGLDRDSSAVGPLNVRYTPRLGLSEDTIIILACVGAAVIIIVAVLVYCCCIKGQCQSSSALNSEVAERLATGQEQMGKLLGKKN
ncbi:cell adhesion molecule 2-like [Branchiostoma floridae x Branchiostoma belcheri]